MEILKTIISKAVLQSNFSCMHEKLHSLLLDLEKIQPEKFLNVENEKELIVLDNKIRDIINGISKNKLETTQILELSQIIFTLKKYLQRGIVNAEISDILIFLSVSCYLAIDVGDFLSEEELSQYATKLLSDKISQLLLRIKLDIQIPTNTPYYEKELVTTYEKGFVANQIVSTYNFIEAQERSSRGFHVNFMLENLIKFLYQLNYLSFVKTIGALTYPSNFVFYFQSFKIENLIRLAIDPVLKNNWLNFELIRQIVKKEQKEKNSMKECEAVKNCLNKIQVSDFTFFIQTVIYFPSSNIFNSALGKLLPSLSNTQINEILSYYCLEIKKTSLNLESKKCFLEKFEATASPKQRNFLLLAVFEKWDSFYEYLLKDQFSSQNELLLTDFGDFIIHYYIYLTSDRDILNEIENLCNKIKYIDTEWTISEVKQISAFHLYYSRFYMLSCAYHFKKLNDSKILSLFSELKNNAIQNERFFKNSQIRTIDIIEQNLKQ